MWVVQLLSYLAFFLALPILWFHPKLRHGLRERLGYYATPCTLSKDQPRIWLHGASAGDVLALLPLAQALKQKKPNLVIIVSMITNSGRAMAERYPQVFDVITYLPYDMPGATNRALTHWRPQTLVMEYTELWPNLIYAARRQNIAMVLHNGRFSKERLQRYMWLFWVTGNLLRQFSLLLMRDEHEAEAARRLGASESVLRVTGNTKFDNLEMDPSREKVEELRKTLGFGANELVWVAGSTHAGEEELLYDVYVNLRLHFPEMKLVLAPRYIERAERLLQLATRFGLKARLRSAPNNGSDVVVLDTIGELRALYELATVVFVGGSFIPRGGQNILEPAASSKPVLFGPFMGNFADAVQVLLGRGGIQVADKEQLQRVLADLLRRPEQIRELGAMARAQVRAIRGAAIRNADLIVDLLAKATAD